MVEPPYHAQVWEYTPWVSAKVSQGRSKFMISGQLVITFQSRTYSAVIVDHATQADWVMKSTVKSSSLPYCASGVLYFRFLYYFWLVLWCKAKSMV